jgi:DNA-binding transcriptional regulator YhcF (GntR family)
METQRKIAQEVFDALIDDAIEDLRHSGLDNEEILSIIEEEFGLPYARKFCEKA